MQKIIPCLWFDLNAEEAVGFYTSIFKNSKIDAITHYGKAAAKASGQPEGTVMTITFHLDGQEFMALNGGPNFKFTEAISLVFNCRSQQEIDEYWSKLSAGGEPGQCGWLKDKFGLSWQIVPASLSEMIQDQDPKRTERVISALMQMTKLNVAELERAYAGS